VNSTGPVDNLGGGPNLVTECGLANPTDAQPDGGDRWFEVVRTILPQINSTWWNTSTIPISKPGDRDQLLLKALTDARYELTSKLGKDINTWTWGRLHKLELRNSALGNIGSSLTKVLLNRGPWQMSGGEAAVDATGWSAAVGYDTVWVPSFRMVVNLADFDESRWINLTGASGHAYSAHYSDQTSMWVTGRMLTWAYSQGSVSQAAKDKLTLTP
jgi:penicillin amidase